jgi:hypothetical protein
MMSGIVSLPGKGHVVFAEFVEGRAEIDLRRLMPEGELALAGHEVCAKNPVIVI